MIVSPEMNDGRNIFVFDSNLAGRHGAGAALTAKLHWGAVQYVGSGRTGQAYAIATKDNQLNVLPLSEIESQVDCFLGYANENDHLVFLVTAIGCGLAGYNERDIAPMFNKRLKITNLVLPIGWEGYL